MKIQKDPKLWDMPEKGYRIETEDESWQVSTMIRVNQEMSQLNLQNTEAIAYDNDTDEVVSRLFFEDGKLKWGIYRHLPTMADIMAHFDRAKKALRELEKMARRTTKKTKRTLRKADKNLENLERGLRE